jgi:hypothetical protein
MKQMKARKTFRGVENMAHLTQRASALLLVVPLAACSAGATTFYQPFGNPLPPARVSSAGVSIPPQQQLPVVTQPQGGNRPSVVINATPQKVQDTITARARARGTNILGANRTGVTLEVPLRASSPVVTEQCGAHQEGRTLRVYLETLPNGSGTTVTEDRFVIDGGSRTCKLQLTQTDIDEANRSLAELKQQSETQRTASAPSSSAPRSSTPRRAPTVPSAPGGGLEPLAPGRPVVPLR